MHREPIRYKPVKPCVFDGFKIDLIVIVILIAIAAVCAIVTNPKPDKITSTASAEAVTTTYTTTSTTPLTTTTVTTMTTTTTEQTTTTTTTYDLKERLIDYGDFSATYYHGRYTNPCPGGSGRMLLDCTPKDDEIEIKGSVACRRIQEDYGYNVNGRTRVYLEMESHPEMNGWYFVDDACEKLTVVDFYFVEYEDCPWCGDIPPSVHLWMEVS